MALDHTTLSVSFLEVEGELCWNCIINSHWETLQGLIRAIMLTH